MSMFCYQCQETAMGTGCTLKGVCGKTSEVANLQDLLLFVVRGIAVYNEHLRKEGQSSEQADKFIYDALFITITNANFDKVAITEKIKEGLKLKKELAGKVKIENAPDECLWDGNEEEFEEKSKTVGVLRTPNEDIRSLKELVHYGLKGMAAYVEHAHNLGYQSPEIFAFMQHALSELTRNDITVEELVQLTLETGKHGVSAMAQLDKANTSSYGNPEISQVSCTSQQVEEKPNVIVILADDLGFGDVSAYGSTTIHTPNIDSLAHGGVCFTNGYATSATSTPSRYALMTGMYPWKNKEAKILPGDAPLIINENQFTLPKMMQQCGYATGAIGKWHLGMGDGNVNWNETVKPGAKEIGFDYSCLIAATNDRVPTVYVENGDVVGLDPADPIEVSYEHNFEGEPTAISHPEMLKMQWAHGHNNSIVNGIPRIGYMKGGQKARWKDEENT